MTTTRVDFYQLSRDPVDVTVAKLARKVLQAGERLVVVSGDDAQRTHLSLQLRVRPHSLPRAVREVPNRDLAVVREQRHEPGPRAAVAPLRRPEDVPHAARAVSLHPRALLEHSTHQQRTSTTTQTLCCESCGCGWGAVSGPGGSRRT